MNRHIFCFGCRGPIFDRQMLESSDNRRWHPQCLKCSICGTSLNTKLYTKGGNIFCPKDYFDHFGPKCHACTQNIVPDEYVQKIFGPEMYQPFVYHVSCFRCVDCNKMLEPGEKFSFAQGRVLCQTHAAQNQQHLPNGAFDHPSVPPPHQQHQYPIPHSHPPPHHHPNHPHHQQQHHHNNNPHHNPHHDFPPPGMRQSPMGANHYNQQHHHHPHHPGGGGGSGPHPPPGGGPPPPNVSMGGGPVNGMNGKPPSTVMAAPIGGGGMGRGRGRGGGGGGGGGGGNHGSGPMGVLDLDGDTPVPTPPPSTGRGKGRGRGRGRKSQIPS